MTELDALKARLREAKQRLTTRQRPIRAHDESMSGHHSKLWDLKLQMAMEHNFELEKRLAWEIETRNLVEQYTRQQIRQLQEILEKLLRQQQQQHPSHCPNTSTPHTTNSFPAPFMTTQPNSLSPLLTEVMHVQLKFAETMQSLNQSVQTRESLLFSTPPQMTSRRRKHRQPEDDDTDSDGDVDMLPKASYTTFLDHNGASPPGMHEMSYSSPHTRSSSSRPTTFHSSSMDGNPVSTSLLFTSPLAGPDSATPPTDDSRRSVHFLDTTPTVGRAISFNDCQDDDDDDGFHAPASPHATTETFMPDAPFEERLVAAACDDSSITSSALNRSSFLQDFEAFRSSLKPMQHSGGDPQAVTYHGLQNSSSSNAVYLPESSGMSKKAQWSLEAQRLSTERALLQLEGSGTPTQLKQLDDAIAYARSQVAKFTSTLPPGENPI